jgi:hypothetical protein
MLENENKSSVKKYARWGSLFWGGRLNSDYSKRCCRCNPPWPIDLLLSGKIPSSRLRLANGPQLEAAAIYNLRFSPVF